MKDGVLTISNLFNQNTHKNFSLSCLKCNYRKISRNRQFYVTCQKYVGNTEICKNM
jgi:hypothetical protein